MTVQGLKTDPSEGSFNDKNYYGAIEQQYGKQFYRSINFNLLIGNIFIYLGQLLEIYGLGPYTGFWEVTSVRHNVDKNNFSTSVVARRYTNFASKGLGPVRLEEQELVVNLDTGQRTKVVINNGR